MGTIGPRPLHPDSCARCGAEVQPGQEYCLECGARLPSPRGVLPALAGAWRARLRWYPGDWVWSALLLLGVAAAGGAVALAATDDEEPRALPLVATFDRPVPAPPRSGGSATPLPQQRPRTTRPPTETPAPESRRPRRLVAWPAGTSGYTVVLVSFPASAGKERALRTARRALRAGLPDVGYLDSSKYPSLHPDYYVVFSGIYESADDAASALTQAHERGFPRAYTRQIVS